MSDGKQVGAFEALLGELDTMTKALPADGGDKVIAAAAGSEGEDGGKKPAIKKEGEEEELDADGNPMVKSLKVTLADGTVVDAEDGTALVKALIGRIDDTEDVIAKALSATVGLVKKQGEIITQQAEIIKSLQADVQKIGNQGNGRKTLVNIHETASATLAKSSASANEIDGTTFMAKANTAFGAGKITGKELTFIDVALRQNQANVIDQNLVAKILA